VEITQTSDAYAKYMSTDLWIALMAEILTGTPASLDSKT